MTDTPTDTFDHGIGLTTLAAENGTVDNIREESPVAVHGVLVPENTVLRGGQDVDHFYSPQMAERAAGVLSQQIEDGETVHLVKNFHEPEGQAPADDIIGEVTAAAYSQGVGVVFEAETTDIETAQKIQNGYLDVSPSVARALGELDDTMQARAVDEVAAFRDVAVVGRGQPGAEVNVGPNPAVEALQRDALARAFDTLAEAAGVSWAGTKDGSLDESRLDADEHTLSDHYLYGSGEDKEDFSYPVVDADRNLRRGNVDSAHDLGCRGQCPDADTHDENLRALAEAFDDPPAWATDETDTNQDTMSLDDAIDTIAEEYDLDADEVEARLTDDDPDETPDDVAVLVEADE